MFSGSPPRRIAAVVLPLLACEVAGARGPLAVLIDRAQPEVEEAARTIDAVDEAALTLGVRPGQRVSEAVALQSSLRVVHVAQRSIEAALARVADVALGMGPTVAIGGPDTVWVDVGGSSHLWGGEEALLAELEERVRALGHRVRVAIADGPRLARALARFTQHAGVVRVAPPGQGAAAIAPLPVRALFPGDGAEEVISLLARLGVWKVEDLVKLPAAAASARLGPSAQDVLALARGVDLEPLVPHVPAERIVETTSLEEGVENAAGLVFVARGLVSRGAARLAARGQATSRIDLELTYDRSIAALVVANDISASAHPGSHGEDAIAREAALSLDLAIDLPAPLVHETDLLRAVKAKVEALVLLAPVVAVRLALSRIDAAPEVQLGMRGGSGRAGRGVDLDAMAAVLSELSAEIGSERVGVLAVRDDHRPEGRSVLEPPRLTEPGGAARAARSTARSAARVEKDLREAFGARASDFDVDLLPSPTRLLSTPVALAPGLSRVSPPRIEPGTTLVVGRHVFVVDRVDFDRRVDGARWWTSAPASRDYLRVWLRSTAPVVDRSPGPARRLASCFEAWVYVDRRTGAAVVQGLWE